MDKPTCLSNLEIEARLTGAGIRATAQRIAICRYVLCVADHPTAEQVKTWVDQHFPKMSLATVYNTLNTLVQARLLKELKFPHCESALYDSNISHHYHFLNQETGELLDLDPSQVEIKASLPAHLQLLEVEVLLRGKER